MKTLIASLASLFLVPLPAAHSQAFQAVTPPENIKTVRLSKPGHPCATPIIQKGECLILSFDDLKPSPEAYRYTLIRYTRDWRQTSRPQSEYIRGVNSAYIEPQARARTPELSYRHYRVCFPDEKMQIRLSGNYSIRIFVKDKDKPILERRFCLYEAGSHIALSLEPDLSARLATQQQLSAKVRLEPYLDPIQNSWRVYAYAFQNTNWNTLKGPFKAQRISPDSLDYHAKDLRFAGGEEFHRFNTEDRRAAQGSTARSVRKKGLEHRYLKTDNPWNGKRYDFFRDLDGSFVIPDAAEPDAQESARKADYCWVHFSLNSFHPYIDEEVYVVGAFDDWRCDRESKMHFDPETGNYQAAILLKRGLYNYGYATREAHTRALDYTEIDGSNWKTENRYHFLLYLRLRDERFDRLIGVAELDTQVHESFAGDVSSPPP